MHYQIPTIRSCKDGFERLAALREHTDSVMFDTVELNFAGCTFFDAHMAAALKTVLTAIENNQNKVVLLNIPPPIEAILRKNHFLCDYGHSRVWDANQTTLPYRCFTLEDSHLFVEYLDNHLEGKGVPEMMPGLKKRFRQSIFEIFENCVMHSKSINGVFVCGQFYPRLHHLDLTISDVGVGIRTNVRQKFPKISSVEAIRWALQEGNTTKNGSQPGGFGLKLLQEFIELNQGKVQIASRLGYYEFSGGHARFEAMEYDMPGTTINFEINTNDAKTYGLRSEISPRDIF